MKNITTDGVKLATAAILSNLKVLLTEICHARNDGVDLLAKFNAGGLCVIVDERMALLQIQTADGLIVEAVNFDASDKQLFGALASLLAQTTAAAATLN